MAGGTSPRALPMQWHPKSWFPRLENGMMRPILWARKALASVSSSVKWCGSDLAKVSVRINHQIMSAEFLSTYCVSGTFRGLCV